MNRGIAVPEGQIPEQYRNGPILWNKLLEIVRTLDPVAVIAGGAVRDYVLGVEPKDIDVFVNADRKALEKWFDDGRLLQLEAFELGLLGPTMQDMNYALDTDWSPDSMAALDGTWFPARDDPSVLGVQVKVQIIAHPIDDFADLNAYADAIMNRMDIGLCQAVWKEGAEDLDIMTTPAFHHDKKHGTLTIIRQQSAAGLRASINRVERIKQRLNNMLNCEIFDWRDA